MNAIERMGIRTVHNLPRFPLIQVNRMRGVGIQTRRELTELVRRLARRFPEAAGGPKVHSDDDVPAEAGRAPARRCAATARPAQRAERSRRSSSTLSRALLRDAGRDLQQRHGDLLWRIRFGEEHWLYLVLLLELQATVDPAMAVRMLTYTALLYQRLDADGAIREHGGALPPVLPAVLYNGRRPWTAPVEMADLVAAGARCWHHTNRRGDTIFWTRRGRPTRTCRRTTGCRRSSAWRRRATRRVWAGALKLLIDPLRAAPDDHLTRAFAKWLRHGLRLADRRTADGREPLAELQEA